jgi:hypothetical protein
LHHIINRCTTSAYVCLTQRTTHVFQRCRHQSSGAHVACGVFTKDGALDVDEMAVRAGLSLVWSNGPTEGFIHRLKLIKRQAYGRAGVDFLRHRILAPSARAAA